MLSYAPFNAVTRKPYNGQNVNRLAIAAEKLGGLHDPRWMTFLQAKALGLSVKRGQHGTKIGFWQFAGKDNSDRQEQSEQQEQQNSGKSNRRLVRKIFVVFHASQIEGMEDYNGSN